MIPAFIAVDMQLNFSIINLVILLGAIQGLIFSMIVAFNRDHPGAKFLSLLMLAFAYNGFETFNWSSGLSDHYLFFDLFPFIIIFSIGPSLYLYVRALLSPAAVVSSKDVLRHYAIVIFQFAFRLGTLAFHFLWTNNWIETSITPGEADQLFVSVSEPLSVIFFIGYLIATFVYYQKKKKDDTLAKSKSDRKIVYPWITALLLCMTVLAVAWPLTIIAPYILDIQYSAEYYPIELALVFFIYWTAFVGYYNTKVIYGVKATSLSRDEEAKHIIAVLEKAMKVDKLYQNPDLNLKKVAAHTGISAKTISYVLNQHLGNTFIDFVNNYRILEVQSRLLLPENRNLTILGIAFDCGFNSQATFQRVFKRTTGMSPTAFVELQLAKKDTHMV